MAFGKSLELAKIQPPPMRVFWPATAGPYRDPKRKERKAAAKEKKARRRAHARSLRIDYVKWAKEVRARIDGFRDSLRERNEIHEQVARAMGPL